MSNETNDKKIKAGRGWKILTGVLCGIAAVSLAGSGFSHAMYGRSLAASAVQVGMRAALHQPSYEEEVAALAAEAARPEEVYEMPSYVKFDEEWAIQDWDGMRTVYINSENTSNITLWYLHGGACVQQPSAAHWRFLNRLANATDAEIIVPLYPLAPHHTYEETYQKIIDLYAMWRPGNNSRNIIFMGDSAGAGLLVGCVQRMRNTDIVYPAQMVLISPWVDLSMSNPEIANYEASDAVLSPGWLRAAGESWAGDTDVADGAVSMLNEDLKYMPETLIIQGTADILYPDAVKLAEGIEAGGSPVEFVTGEGLGHVYPLWPIPEADDAMEAICDYILPHDHGDEGEE